MLQMPLHQLFSQQKSSPFSWIPLRQISIGIFSYQSSLHPVHDRPVPFSSGSSLLFSFLLPHKKAFWLVSSASDDGNLHHPHPSGSAYLFPDHFSRKHRFPHKQISDAVSALVSYCRRSAFSGCLLWILKDQFSFLSIFRADLFWISPQIGLLFQLLHESFSGYAAFCSVRNPHSASLSASVPVHPWISAQMVGLSHAVLAVGETYPQGLLLFPPVFFPSAHRLHGC